MRIALVSPYSWTYPGGVARHIEALAGELHRQGHDAHVLAPFDPPDRLAARMHRGAWPQDRTPPEWLVPLGRTIGVPANGGVSNLAGSPGAIRRLRQALDSGGYDVVHLHEPHAPLLGWDTLLSCDSAPLVGTFHCYSTNTLTNGGGVAAGARRRLNRLVERIAVSDAAAWTGQRYYGGRYRVIPNGVELPTGPATIAPAPVARPAGELRIAFVGQAVERKGLPILLRAFEALREQLPVELVIIGPDEAEVRKLTVEDDLPGVRILGRVDDDTKHRELAACDVLCAPSLGGESFGMVLTEAFAQGVPVVASDIVGYRDVVTSGRDGVLVPPGDALALAHSLRELALRPERRRRMSEAARKRAQRYAWPRIAQRVVDVYEDAQHAPQPETRVDRYAVRRGWKPADGRPAVPARRMPPPDATPESTDKDRTDKRRRLVRRGLIATAGVATVGLGAMALQRIGLDSIGNSLLRSSPLWVLLSLGVMVLSMGFRAISWHAILRAAIPEAVISRTATFRATAIGVMMSATLPARLGEPSRALIMARRIGRPRERFPVVLGTLVSQTLINLLALVILGVIMLSSIKIFSGHDGALVTLAVAPAVLLLILLFGPVLLRIRLGRGTPGRVHRLQQKLRSLAQALRAGLRVFVQPRLGAVAVSAQLFAWVLQCLSCWILLRAFGIEEGIGAAAAVLFAVNVTAVLPVTPSNLGVFQAACVTVLTLGYGVTSADALGYGIVLQVVEIGTALILGAPAMLREGVTWRDVRTRALHATPVVLPPLPHGVRTASDGE
ncbi:MAG: lysylphosphatidylglycerol synthase domain-containing protein [Patulibacter sp.]